LAIESEGDTDSRSYTAYGGCIC